MGQVITRRKKRHKRRIASLTGGTKLPPIRSTHNLLTVDTARRHHTVPLRGLPHLGTLHPRVGRPSTAFPKLPSIQLFNERVSGLSSRLSPPSNFIPPSARQPSAEHIEPIRHYLSSDTSYSDDSFEDDEDFDLNQQSQQLFEQQQLEQQRLEQEHQRLEQEKQRELEQQRLEQLEQEKQRELEQQRLEQLEQEKQRKLEQQRLEQLEQEKQKELEQRLEQDQYKHKHEDQRRTSLAKAPIIPDLHMLSLKDALQVYPLERKCQISTSYLKLRKQYVEAAKTIKAYMENNFVDHKSRAKYKQFLDQMTLTLDGQDKRIKTECKGCTLPHEYDFFRIKPD